MDHPADALLPPDLIAEVEALAAVERRSSRDILREAVELYLQDRKPVAEPRPKLTPKEAAARMLQLRKGNVLPDGVTIRDLMTYGRA